MRSVVPPGFLYLLAYIVICAPAGAQQTYDQAAEEPQQPYQGIVQTDITGGMADRSAQYAAQQIGAPPPQPSAAYPQQQMQMPVQQMPMQPQQMPMQPQQMPMQPQQMMMNQQAMYPAQQGYAQYPAGYQYATPPAYAAPPPYNGCYAAPGYPMQPYGYPMQYAAPQPQQSSGGFGGNSKLMSQAIGVLGAATMFNYMKQGGLDTILGPLKDQSARGGGNKFRTFGSSPGGNIYQP
jgi:hypothetical protein